MALLDDKIDLNLFAFWFLSITIVFGFLLTIILCCGEKKPRENSDQERRLSHETKKTIKSVSAESTDVSKDRGQKSPPDEKSNENALKMKENIPKARDPENFAEVKDYQTLMGHLDMNPTVRTQIVINDAPPKPRQEETMAFNVMTDSKRRELENKATKKGAPKVVDQTEDTDEGTKPIPTGKDTKNILTDKDASKFMVYVERTKQSKIPQLPTSKEIRSTSSSKEDKRKVPPTIIPQAKYLQRQDVPQPYDTKAGIRTSIRSEYVVDNKIERETRTNVGRGKDKKYKDTVYQEKDGNKDKDRKEKDNRPQSKQFRSDPKQSMYSWNEGPK